MENCLLTAQLTRAPCPIHHFMGLIIKLLYIGSSISPSLTISNPSTGNITSVVCVGMKSVSLGTWATCKWVRITDKQGFELLGTGYECHLYHGCNILTNQIALLEVYYIYTSCRCLNTYLWGYEILHDHACLLSYSMQGVMKEDSYSVMIRGKWINIYTPTRNLYTSNRAIWLVRMLQPSYNYYRALCFAHAHNWPSMVGNDCWQPLCLYLHLQSCKLETPLAFCARRPGSLD